MSQQGSEEKPLYGKQLQEPNAAQDALVAAQGGATKLYMITVDEGWKSWILCTDMYEWAADKLLVILRASNARWSQ